MGDTTAMATLSSIQNASMQETPMEEDQLRAIFEALDTNGTGTIPADEFIKSLRIFGGENAFTPDEITVLKKEMGMDNSTGFDYNEFLKLRSVLLARAKAM